LQIQLNGEVQEVTEGCSLSELVQLLSLKPEQIAIELNREVIRRSEWANTTLQPEDKVEVVHFVGGGANYFFSGGQGRSERI
jgi:thiamine biosynthesis protein ThiS